MHQPLIDMDMSATTRLSHFGAPSRRALLEVRHNPQDARSMGRRPVGRPRALDAEKVALVNRLHASGVSKAAIARTLGVSRPTIYRALAEV